eukprot:m.9990 g.9990  ORF g.9990 m.9990 type:complete len:340 (-) comp8047_c0_seq1:163-1182(-)
MSPSSSPFFSNITMNISDNFSVLSALNALVGGIGIGAVCAIYTAVNGKTMPSATFNLESHSGLALTAIGYALFSQNSGLFESSVPSFPVVRTIVAGLLVGSGSKLGNGCTSGNGVQGLSTLSLASLVFVVLFMGAGAITTTVFNSAALMTSAPTSRFEWELAVAAGSMLALQFGLGNAGQKSVSNVVGGSAFALSLIISSMVKPSKVVQFLDVFNASGWDPSLAFVMGGGVLVTMIFFRPLMDDRHKAKRGTSFEADRHDSLHSFAARPVSLDLIAGALMFGVGWGLTGICPGPGLINSVYFCTLGAPQALVWGAAMFAGHKGAGALQSEEKKRECQHW